MITFFCLVLTKASLMAGGEHGDMKKRIVVTCRLSHQKTTMSIPLSEVRLRFTCSELEVSYREICNDILICSTARQLLINEYTSSSLLDSSSW
uniref:Putative ovule protein n=1 Tax=Solanum chacoense TaxID=4108 RepID=A0A0V0I141_SOLCH